MASALHNCLNRVKLLNYRFNRFNVFNFIEKKTNVNSSIQFCRKFTTKTVEDLNKIRNIGIIAHVDAGKTTTSERMLYYAGILKQMGDVDDGDTTMDFLKMERERGITIQSAVISFNWLDHKINLVDTPGHVDFTIEVERSVRVLDGAVAIFDAVHGVQAQTETVWKQADRYNVPRLAFINKLDREGSNINQTLGTMYKRLKSNPLLIQYPIGEGIKFQSVIDIVDFEIINWTNEEGTIIERVKITEEKNPKIYKIALSKKRELIEELANLDEQFLHLAVENNDESLKGITSQHLKEAIRRVTLNLVAVPVLVGSALKNRGIQLLMDAIIAYLPSPIDRPKVEALDQNNKMQIVDPLNNTDLCALAFKVIHDHRRGLIVYLRVYSGQIESGDVIYNVNRNVREKINNVVQIKADEMIPLTSISSGNMGAAIGLRETCTGDTLIRYKAKDQLKLVGMSVPQPVFFCSIEPPNFATLKTLENALELLQKEDPSFHLTHNSDTGQMLVSGMGELHLEVIKDRLLTHYKVNARMGKIQIAYRMTATKSVSNSEYSLESVSGDKVTIVISVNLATPGQGVSYMNDLFGKEAPELQKNFEIGAQRAIRRGVMFGFQVEDIQITLISYKCNGNSEQLLQTFAIATEQAVLQALRESEPKIIEPIMLVEIETPSKYVGSIMSDISSHRRGSIVTVGATTNELNSYFEEPNEFNSNTNDSSLTLKIISAIPLRQLISYANVIRSLSQGKANFTMQFHKYDKMSEDDERALIQQLKGF
eukprot:TRINITY_DN3885_c0_g1_i1.p1 TRINITY_DN3885_c0_g1~~TRINITY_DN3885_c0_g1_i1.p1  ORF type:complete len:780 (-),score=358.52 TRINITY_DN3885_c0_g1_i1:80-2383(-)